MASTYNLAGSLDTNILLRLIRRDVPSQFEKVVSLLEEPNAMYHISDLAITEMVHVLKTDGVSRPEIAEAINMIMMLLNVRMNRPLFKRVIPLYLEHPKLSFNDCYLAVLAELDNATPLWTFDHALAQQAPSAQLAA